LEETYSPIEGFGAHMGNLEPEVRIGGICERDIDLLLLEEFVASPEFCKWFLSSIGFSGRIGVRSLLVISGSLETIGESHPLNEKAGRMPA
jgi:hypothetical protein